MATATSGDEIWVAASIYPTAQAFDDTTTFTLKSGVALYGGFTAGDMDKDSRNFSTSNLLGGSILSGKTDNNNSSSLFAWHVVTADGADNTAILDGFTINQSYSDGTGSDNFGGGLHDRTPNFVPSQMRL